jgi:hypothetical protein
VSAAEAATEPAPLTLARVAATLWLGSVGLLIQESSLSCSAARALRPAGKASLGSVATVEILTIAIGSVIGARLLQLLPARAVA